MFVFWCAFGPSLQAVERGKSGSSKACKEFCCYLATYVYKDSIVRFSYGIYLGVWDLD